ncbi:MAG: AMP-binding protein, partial [Gemmatimonadales bacterium]|nr:AMP-binding protein [Gemmatimonadales bacterium]
MNLNVLFENAVTKHRGRVAFQDARSSVSFAEIDRRTRGLGSSLLVLGLDKGSRIASLQYNSIETFEVDAAAARFGFVRTLLNARYGLDDFEYALNHSGACALVFESAFSDIVQKLRPRLPKLRHYICVGDDNPAWSMRYEDMVGSGEAEGPSYDVADTDWHSIYYTSGSTGRPKGVVLSQRNWLVLIRNHLAGPFRKAGADDVLLHAAPMSHASGAMGLTHFMIGARQVVMPKFDALEALRLIEREKVTTTFLAPTMIQMLLRHPEHDRYDKSSLHSVLYGGAPMPVEHLKEAMRAWGAIFVQGYGQWEAPQLVAYLDQEQHRVAVEQGLEHRLASTGTPVLFCAVAIMDDEGNLLPAGTEGEIVTSGDHLMVGYLDNPEATAADRHGIWQRSGDVGRIDADGFLYITDRKKELIITGGSNVYPREIEETLHTHPDV